MIFTNSDFFSLLVTLDYLHEIFYLLKEKLLFILKDRFFHIATFLNEMKSKQATLRCAENTVFNRGM